MQNNWNTNFVLKLRYVFVHPLRCWNDGEPKKPGWGQSGVFIVTGSSMVSDFNALIWAAEEVPSMAFSNSCVPST